MYFSEACRKVPIASGNSRADYLLILVDSSVDRQLLKPLDALAEDFDAEVAAENEAVDDLQLAGDGALVILFVKRDFEIVHVLPLKYVEVVLVVVE